MPADLEVLFVPGGFGTNETMQDADILAFLADRGKTARYVHTATAGSDMTRLVTGMLQDPGEGMARLVETATKVRMERRITA